MRFNHDNINLWFATADAPAPQGAVPAADGLVVTVAIQSIDSSNQVEVLFRTHGKGTVARVSAPWLWNDTSKNISYFLARLPNFSVGDRVEYTAVCRCAGRQVPARFEAEDVWVRFNVDDGCTTRQRQALSVNTAVLDGSSISPVVPSVDDVYSFIEGLLEKKLSGVFNWAVDFFISQFLKLFGLGGDPDTKLLEEIIENQKAIMEELHNLKVFIEWQDLGIESFAPTEHLIAFFEQLMNIGNDRSSSERDAEIKRLHNAILDPTNGVVYDMTTINSVIVDGNPITGGDGLLAVLVQRMIADQDSWNQQTPGDAYSHALKYLQGLFHLQYMGLILLANAYLGSKPAEPKMAGIELNNIATRMQCQYANFFETIPKFWRAYGVIMPRKSSMNVVVDNKRPVNYGPNMVVPYLSYNPGSRYEVGWSKKKYSWQFSRAGGFTKITALPTQAPGIGIVFTETPDFEGFYQVSDFVYGPSRNAWVFLPTGTEKYYMCGGDIALKMVGGGSTDGGIALTKSPSPDWIAELVFEVQAEIVAATVAGEVMAWSRSFSNVPKGFGPNWQPGYWVRYAYSFLSDYGESEMSPWATLVPGQGTRNAEGYINNNGYFLAQIRLPRDPLGLATSYRIYRQFVGKKCQDVTAGGQLNEISGETWFHDWSQ